MNGGTGGLIASNAVQAHASADPDGSRLPTPCLPTTHKDAGSILIIRTAAETSQAHTH